MNEQNRVTLKDPSGVSSSGSLRDLSGSQQGWRALLLSLLMALGCCFVSLALGVCVFVDQGLQHMQQVLANLLEWRIRWCKKSKSTRHNVEAELARNTRFSGFPAMWCQKPPQSPPYRTLIEPLEHPSRTLIEPPKFRSRGTPARAVSECQGCTAGSLAFTQRSL